MTAQRAKSSQASGRLVWHVTDYRVRFELRDDVKIGRQSPLAYAKLHVRPNDMGAVTYLRQLGRLRQRDDGAELEGFWTRIIQFTSDADFAHRGYLVNDTLRPASIDEIARDVLLCDGKRAAVVLKVLCEIGLAEEVLEPDWKAREAEGERIADAAKNRSKTGKKPAPKNAKSGRGKSVSRNVPECSGAAGNTLRPSRTKSETEEESRKKEEELNRKQIERNGEAKATERGAQGKDHPTPTATPPEGSGEPRRWGGSAIKRSRSPPHVDTYAGPRGQAEPLPLRSGGLGLRRWRSSGVRVSGRERTGAGVRAGPLGEGMA